MAVVLLAPSAALLGLGLASGGFFPDTISIAAIIVIVMFSVRAMASPAPFSGLPPGLVLVAVGLIAFTVWTLVSSSWSNSSARAVFEYDRALLYTSTFVLTGLLGRSEARARLLVYGLTAVGLGLCIAASATWLLPHVFPVTSTVPRARLSWPTSYWNATGLIAALALVWTTSLTCSAKQPPVVRVLAAMGAPLTVATLIFTVSRGAVAVAALGVLIAVVTLRSAATPGGLATLAPAVVGSGAIALAVRGLNVVAPSPHEISAGERTAVLLIAVAFGAAALRAALLPLDARLARTRVPWTRRQVRVVLGISLAVLAAGFVATGGPRLVRNDVHEFASAGTAVVNNSLPASTRLTRFGNNGRIDNWRVAFDDGFIRHPIVGIGAGTFATLWTRYAPRPTRVLNAHSLYLEALAELGIVGGVLVLAVVASILVALALRVRGPGREIWAPLLAAGVVWAVHAGVDWDWQMPSITVWFFAAGGLALAAPIAGPRSHSDPRIRFAVGLGCLLLAITPAIVWRSQTQIVKAVQAFERGDCPTAEKAALASNAALSSRSDPFEVISYCETGAGRFSLALAAINAAETRDPENWELRYSDSLIRALAGLDPRAAARAALLRFPTSPLTRNAVQAFSHGDRATWRRFAISAPLPLPTTRQ